ncbi:hypothetical protein ACJMK2_029755, partial [Sinanodonta woodiana]
MDVRRTVLLDYCFTDKLPSGFSDTLQKEEDKVHVRPKFDTTLVREKSLIKEEDVDVQSVEKPNEHKGVGAMGQVDMKKWILQYAEQSDSDSVGEDEDGDQFNTNERYIELTAILLDLKEEAAETKQMGNKSKQKELSKQIREIIVEMDSLEKHPDFDPAVKIKNIESEKVSANSSIVSMVKEQSSGNPDLAKVDDVDDIGSGLNLIEQAAAETPKPQQETNQATKVKEDVRRFEYTRQQWTGKSPKQFLIDWCRKQKCENPKFEKINSRGNKFKC